MRFREVIDNENGRKWEIYKKEEGKYYIKYYEYYKAIGWSFLWQDGGYAQGFYYSKEVIEDKFGIIVA